MSITPAAELARIKLQHPGWAIECSAPGNGAGYTARYRTLAGQEHVVYAPTLAALEQSLWLREKDGIRDPRPAIKQH